MTDDLASVVARRSPTRPRTGVVAATHAGSGVVPVMVGGVVIDAVSELPDSVLHTGDPVIVEASTTGAVRIVRSLAWRPTVGTITAVQTDIAGTIQTVTVQATHPTRGTCTLTARTTATVATMAQVQIRWTGEGAIVSPILGSAGPLASTIRWDHATTDPATQATAGLPDDEDDSTPSTTVRAIDSATWAGHWDDSDTLTQGSLVDGATTLACWLYGAHIDAVAGWQVSSASVHIVRSMAGSGPATLHLVAHTASDRLDSPSTIGPTVDVGPILPGEHLDVDIPLQLAQQLADGTAQGIAVTASGATDWCQLIGAGTDITSGLLTIRRS